MPATYGHVAAAGAEALARLEAWAAPLRPIVVTWVSLEPHRVTARLEVAGCWDPARLAAFLAEHIDGGEADAEAAAYFPQWETTGHGADLFGDTAWVTLRADSVDALAAAEADRAEAAYCYAAGAANDRAERRYLNGGEF